MEQWLYSLCCLGYFMSLVNKFGRELIPFNSKVFINSVILCVSSDLKNWSDKKTDELMNIL